MMMMVKSHRGRLHLGDDDREAAHPKEYRGAGRKIADTSRKVYSQILRVFLSSIRVRWNALANTHRIVFYVLGARVTRGHFVLSRCDGFI